MSTQAQIRSAVKSNQKKDAIMIRPSKDNGALIRNAAAQAGKPVQRYILDIVLPIAKQALDIVDQEDQGKAED